MTIRKFWRNYFLKLETEMKENLIESRICDLKFKLAKTNNIKFHIIVILSFKMTTQLIQTKIPRLTKMHLFNILRQTIQVN